MAHKVRCPLCGNMATLRQVSEFHPIEVFVCHGLGKGRGFSFEKTLNDGGFISLVKQKILRLYERFFPAESRFVPSTVGSIPSMRVLMPAKVDFASKIVPITRMEVIS